MTCGGGTWNETGDGFYQTDAGNWYAYVDSGERAPQPADPSLVTEGGVAYAFVGWTATHPNEWTFVDEDKRVDLTTFDSTYRYDFTKPVTGPVTLYAVWDPDVTGVDLRKVNGAGETLAGAEFTLQRVQSAVTADGNGGYTFTQPVPEENGSYPLDGSFPLRTVTTGENGLGDFGDLPAGYYLLTETTPPTGCNGLSAPVLLFLPYGDGTPQVVGTVPNVSGAGTEDGLAVTVTNVAQYSVKIEAPAALTLTYSPPDLIWDPETLTYEGLNGEQGQWTAQADWPGGAGGAGETITVTNTSPQDSPALTVAVTLDYEDGFAALLPLSTITAGGDGTFEQPVTDETEGSLTLEGTLNSGQKATFTLRVEPFDDPAALPPTGTAGVITVRVTHPTRLNTARAGSRFNNKEI